MNMKTYLEGVDGKLRLDGAELCRIATELKSSPQMVYLIALGHKSVSKNRALRIEELTAGKVTLRELLFGATTAAEAA